MTNGNYRGYPYAVNNRWTKEGKPHSRRRTNESEFIPLPEGIYPRLVDPIEYEEIQEQLRRNKEMASRGNRYPNESLLRSITFCGICGNRMHVVNHKKGYGGRQIQRSEYQCKRNDGLDDLKHHHCVSIGVHILDTEAWEFATPFLLDPLRVRTYIESLKEQITHTDRVSVLEETLTDTEQRIINLFKVAQTANDEFTRELYRQNLADLEKKRRETENLLVQLTNTQEREERLRHALDKFEAWATKQREFLLDPAYEITQEDKRAAILILGVQATVWPAEGYEERVRFELMPPDLSKSIDVRIVKAISLSAKMMREQAEKEKQDVIQ